MVDELLRMIAECQLQKPQTNCKFYTKYLQLRVHDVTTRVTHVLELQALESLAYSLPYFNQTLRFRCYC